MSTYPDCPKCSSEYVYEDGAMLVCPECAHEWTAGAEEDEQDGEMLIKDINGNILNDGDDVVVAKDLKIKGSSSTVKVGTKVKNIRLIDGDHEIDCKIPGFGGMKLRAKFVKKA